MYHKLENGAYINPENGTQYEVVTEGKRLGYFMIRVSNGTWSKFTTGRVLMSGYKTRADALAALDEFADNYLGVSEIQPPYQEEEAVSDEELDTSNVDKDKTSTVDTDGLPGDKMGTKTASKSKSKSAEEGN